MNPITRIVFVGIFFCKLTLGSQLPRIESEHKLTVPVHKTEAVWKYLSERFTSIENNPLVKIDKGFSARVSEEYFVDTYYDSPGLQMLDRQSGIRFRRRFIPDNPSDTKHGRALVQIKLNRKGDKVENRTEYKFDTVENSIAAFKAGYGIGMLIEGEKNQMEFFNRLNALEIIPSQLKAVITLEQKRRRVYISKDGTSFATITLDEVSAKRFFKKVNLTEIELELNEIAYTDSDINQRNRMEHINKILKTDILDAFPEIKVDQTPKYNKVMALFEDSIPLFNFLIGYFG